MLKMLRSRSRSRLECTYIDKSSDQFHFQAAWWDTTRVLRELGNKRKRGAWQQWCDGRLEHWYVVNGILVHCGSWSFSSLFTPGPPPSFAPPIPPCKNKWNSHAGVFIVTLETLTRIIVFILHYVFQDYIFSFQTKFLPRRNHRSWRIVLYLVSSILLLCYKHLSFVCMNWNHILYFLTNTISTNFVTTSHI